VGRTFVYDFIRVLSIKSHFISEVMDMYCIYGYKNKITERWYVGQTICGVNERHRLHLSSAYHQGTSDYNCLFHKKIRQYGIENFELVILEQVQEKSLLDEREQYWINEKKSYVRDNGYNLTTGGQRRKGCENYQDVRAAFSKEQIQEVYEKIINSEDSLTKIANEYNVSLSVISNINSGKKYYSKEFSYPLRKMNQKVTEKDVDEIISFLQLGWTNKEIADCFDIDANIVYRINYGKAHQRDIIYPIRKIDNKRQEKEERAKAIKELLKENKLNNRQIAEIFNCDPSLVSNINYGKNYYDKTLKYPIRQS
jgi:group I intron endonuclease